MFSLHVGRFFIGDGNTLTWKILVCCDFLSQVLWAFGRYGSMMWLVYSNFYLPFVIACTSKELKDTGCYLVVLNRLFIDKNEGINVFDMCERCIASCTKNILCIVSSFVLQKIRKQESTHDLCFVWTIFLSDKIVVRQIFPSDKIFVTCPTEICPISY